MCEEFPYRAQQGISRKQSHAHINFNYSICFGAAVANCCGHLEFGFRLFKIRKGIRQTCQPSLGLWKFPGPLSLSLSLSLSQGTRIALPPQRFSKVYLGLATFLLLLTVILVILPPTTTAAAAATTTTTNNNHEAAHLQNSL